MSSFLGSNFVSIAWQLCVICFLLATQLLSFIAPLIISKGELSENRLSSEDMELVRVLIHIVKVFLRKFVPIYIPTCCIADDFRLMIFNLCHFVR